MALTGLSPTRRTPGIVREFVFGAGISSGVSSDRPVLIFGNKTSAGSETTNTIGAPIASDEDCVLRFGRKACHATRPAHAHAGGFHQAPISLAECGDPLARSRPPHEHF